ncbi:hypothetical protein [Prosthecobacter debontii]|uniref:hypothetical protein n=1 Tax=Prosthecobacter debontii TaxID=48467 RepID=UPI00099908C8|nr:hypothetical protein [Prosthecobacter debontii]
MKTVSIRELHDRTGSIVREAALQPVRVTDRGQVIAVLQAPSAPPQEGVSLPDRESWIAGLPAQKSDAAEILSDDRDR